MQIENKTEFKQEMIKNIMRADGFDNKKYQMKKIIINMSGLLCGMVCVSIFARTMYSLDDSYKSIAFFLGVAWGVLFYAGMYGMDKKKYKMYEAQYAQNIGNVYEYEITSDDIHVKTGDNDYVIPWDDIGKWCEDRECFYLFLKNEDEAQKSKVPVCFVLNKKDFSQAKDFKELCTAIMAVRRGNND